MIFQQKKALPVLAVEPELCVELSLLPLDLLMTVRYSHEAWEGHVFLANSHEAWKGRVCSWRTDTVASIGEDASVQW